MLHQSLNPLSNQGHSIEFEVIKKEDCLMLCLNPLSNQGHSIYEVRFVCIPQLKTYVLIPLVIRVIQSKHERYKIIQGIKVLIPLVIRVIQSVLNLEKNYDNLPHCLNPLSNQGHSIFVPFLCCVFCFCLNPLSNQGHSIC